MKATRIASLFVAIALVASAGGLCAEGESRSIERRALRAGLLHFFDVVPEVDSEAGLKLRLVTPAPGRALVCDDLTAERLFPVRVVFLLGCLAQVDPEQYGDGTVQSTPALLRAAEVAAAQVAKTLDNGSAEDRADARTLYANANVAFDQALEQTGVLDDLLEAWTTYVEGRELCFVEFESRYLELLEQKRQRARQRGECGWPRWIRLCTSDRNELRYRIKLFLDDALTPDRRKAAEALMQYSLGACMARLLEAKAPDVARAILDHNRGDAKLQELNARAWEVWRDHGIERWLDRTLEANGEVPPEVKHELDDCVMGDLSDR